MIERFRSDDTKPYPGKASVIFGTYGPQLRPAADGTVTLGRSDKEPHAFYMEAELNSPMVQLFQGNLIVLIRNGFRRPAIAVFRR